MGRHSERKRSRSRSPELSSRSKHRHDDRERDRGSYRSSKDERSSSRRKRSRSSDRRRDGRRDKDYSRHRSRSPSSKDRYRNSKSPDNVYSSSSQRDRSSRSNRSRSPSHHKSSSRKEPIDSDRPNRERVEDIIGSNVNYKNFDIEEQNKLLERIMQERRERVEKWRQTQKQSLGILDKSSDPLTSGEPEGNDSNDKDKLDVENADTNVNNVNKKKWTLDDDDILDGEDDEDEDNENNGPILDDDDESATLMIPKRDDQGDEDKIEKVVSNEKLKDTKVISKQSTTIVGLSKNAESSVPVDSNIDKTETNVPNVADDDQEDDIDPLDAYMAGIQEEVKKYRTKTVSKKDTNGNDKVTVVIGVAKKKSTIKRGELMEQNQDGMEYSSGDEVTKEDDLANVMDNLQAKTKQKKLLTISQDDITFIPFRKNFYIEVPEIRNMTSEEVDKYKTEMEGIKTKGKGCPRPIKTWAQCGVSKKVLEVLKRNNFEKPTPIQCQAIPAIMSGRDIIGIAKTGSGKTLAFLIPMFRHILDQPRLQPGDGPIAVIMTPTRELATQIYGQCRKFTKYLTHTDRTSGIEGKDARLRVVAVYGGTPISEQIGDLKPGAEIVVCTPGRMIDMLAANSGRVTNLRRCTYIVLDEADRMFDMGFEPQVMRIIDGIRPDRQTVMFSATFPRIMEALARRILDKPIEVQVGGRSVVCKEVEQNIVVINEDDKFLKLLEILGKFSTQGSAITFVDKQEHADMLLKELMHASYTCLALHGGIDQNDRDSTISDFKNGKVNVLVATSVAARGLDVKHCIVVINYDCPNHYEDYVHRCGRTGRAGNKGYAYTFITPEQGRYSNDLIKALDSSGNPIPENLQNLFNQYKQEQELLGKSVKSSSGFSGKGFKFDEAEAQQAVEKKRLQKAALGLNDSDDEEPDAADIDQEIENMLAPKKKTISIVAQPSTSGASSSTQAQSTNSNADRASTTALGGSAISVGALNEVKSIAEKMEMAKALASKITVTKIPVTSMVGKSSATAQTEAILKGDAYSLDDIASAVNAKSIAEQRAERINAKLNYTPRDADYNENGDLVRRIEPQPEFEISNIGQQRFEEELEINEFPQQARWRVTSKEAIAMISEYSEAGITVRGTFYPPGKEPLPGDRKLYLAIEGTSELTVSKARAEIIRLIKEELVKMSNNSYFSLNKGRYKVL